MDISLILDKIIGAAWCREFTFASSEGFSDWFLDDSEDYCIRNDNRIRLTWDSLGHLDVDEVFNDFGDASNVSSASDASSSLSSADPSSMDAADCYELRILGRFLEGPCESDASSSSPSCSDGDCFNPSSVDHGTDVEDLPKDLELCFDELGHLVSVSLCGVLKWHMKGWVADRFASDSAEESDDQFDMPSALTEGVEIEVYLPIDTDEPSSCDLPIRSQCEDLPVRRAVLCFDSLGHLFSVYDVEVVSLPCGVVTVCCEELMPKHMLVTFQLWNQLFPAGSLVPDEQCVIASWDGCGWKGVVSMPCCHHTVGPPPSAELSYEQVDFNISCLRYPMPVPVTPWWLCLGTLKQRFLDFGCCPIDGEMTGVYERSGCDNVVFRLIITEIPCDIQCIDREYFCREPSTVDPPSE